MNRFLRRLFHPLAGLAALLALSFAAPVDPQAPPATENAPNAALLVNPGVHSGTQVHRKPALSALRARLIRRREKDDAGRLVSDSIPQAGSLPLFLAFAAAPPDAGFAAWTGVAVVPACAAADWGLPAILLSRTIR
jgi:hypothetical protein